MKKAAEEQVATEALDPETLREAVEIDTAMARAVHEEQERNRRLGLRNVYVRSGRIVEELPDGTVRDLGPAEPALTADKARSA